MSLNDQKIRAILFYLSVFIFIAGLPFILSFSFGYKFNRRTLKFTKTGLIVLKTQPAGASIYLDNLLLGEKTPATLNELLPGAYELKVELEKYYPWSGQAQVDAGKVSRLEKIILFPLRPNVKQLNKEKLSLFWADEDKGNLYFINPEDKIIYKSDLAGEHFEDIAIYLEITPAPLKFKLSADGKKLLYFNAHQIGITFLTQHQDLTDLDTSFILNYPASAITDVFWHSDSYHLVLVTDKHIEVVEAMPQAQAVILLALNKRNAPVFYHAATDTLYFVDSQAAPDGNFYDNLYKLELNARAFTSQELMKLKTNE